MVYMLCRNVQVPTVVAVAATVLCISALFNETALPSVKVGLKSVARLETAAGLITGIFSQAGYVPMPNSCLSLRRLLNVSLLPILRSLPALHVPLAQLPPS
jgi:hypothetical protein